MSDHEWHWTPSEAEIIRRLLLQEQLGADILKISTMAHNIEDALALMSATAKVRRYYSSKPMLSSAVGPAGVLSRVTGEATGSDMVFCAVGSSTSSPGQIPSEKAKEIMDTLHQAMYPDKK